jgi:hypothetical protein
MTPNCLLFGLCPQKRQNQRFIVLFCLYAPAITCFQALLLPRTFVCVCVAFGFASWIPTMVRLSAILLLCTLCRRISVFLIYLLIYLVGHVTFACSMGIPIITDIPLPGTNASKGEVYQKRNDDTVMRAAPARVGWHSQERAVQLQS